ncbi:hypothetical protein FAES_3214 [Fibrella aestuarina BUZ 2]|uniref:Helix-turn-helix domain-containing protein n=1 Tax=Fibrella aestuarina BUZ 2 TaxID=1166018 RepID=I0KAS0_9BACT|nr:helix-turn-helix domain-containing protein [Fibrella aestuarina]CCH01223.1 hypothetical protein FAES_3214 [Fibrella aestuarina BUZ 2]
MDSASQKGVFIPNDILDLIDLSDQEKMVLAQICYRARHNGGICTDTNDQLAAVTRHHPNSIARAITTLEDIGTLTRGRIGRDRTLTPTTVLVMAVDGMDSASFPTASYVPPPGLYPPLSLNNLLHQPSPSVNVGLTTCEPSTLTNGVGSLHNLLNQSQQLVNGALTKSEATLIIKRNIKLKKGARAGGKQSVKPQSKKEGKQIVKPQGPPQAVTPPPQQPPPAAPTPPTPSPPASLQPASAPLPHWETQEPQNRPQIVDRLHYWHQKILTQETEYLAGMESTLKPASREVMLERIAAFFQEQISKNKKHRDYSDCTSHLWDWARRQFEKHQYKRHEQAPTNTDPTSRTRADLGGRDYSDAGGW